MSDIKIGMLLHSLQQERKEVPDPKIPAGLSFLDGSNPPDTSVKVGTFIPDMTLKGYKAHSKG